MSAYYEEILLGALRLAEADAAQGRLDDERLENIHETVSEVIEDIGSHAAMQTKEIGSAQAADKVVKLDARKLGKTVFCVPGLGRLDDCVALVVADVLKREGFNARISGIDTEIENADMICVCFVEEVSAGSGGVHGKEIRAEGGRGKRHHLSIRKGRRERLVRRGRWGRTAILGGDRWGSQQKRGIEGSKGTIASSWL